MSMDQYRIDALGALIAASATTASTDLDQQIDAVMAVPDDQLDEHLRSIGLDPMECEAAGRRAVEGALKFASAAEGWQEQYDASRAPVQAAQPALPAEYKTCQTCDGKGAFYGETCDTCAGVGKVIAAPGAAQTTDAWEGAWISVDDHLPPAENEDTGREVMVSNSMFIVGEAIDGGHGIGLGDYSPETGWRCYGGDYDFMHITRVTAYMPTPRPGSIDRATHPTDKGQTNE